MKSDFEHEIIKTNLSRALVNCHPELGSGSPPMVDNTFVISTVGRDPFSNQTSTYKISQSFHFFEMTYERLCIVIEKPKLPRLWDSLTNRL